MTDDRNDRKIYFRGNWVLAAVTIAFFLWFLVFGGYQWLIQTLF